MIRGIVALGFAALVLTGIPVASADDVIVDGTEVTATRTDGVTTVEVTLINSGTTPVTLSPQVPSGGCTVSAEPLVLPALQSTDVTLTLEAGCPAAALVTIDVDGATGRAPLVHVKPVTAAAASFSQLRLGAVGAALLAGVSLLFVRRRVGQVVTAANDPTSRTARKTAHQALLAKIAATQAATHFTPDPAKLPVEPNDVAVGWSTPLDHLEAEWKFSDSWLANANVGIAGLVTFLSTTDVLDAVLTTTPATVTSTVAITAGLSLLLVAVANAALRVFGSQSKVPTVGGFTVALALSVFATTLNVVTLAATLDDLDSDLGLGESKSLILWGAVIVLLVAMMRYVWVSVREVIETGISDPGPAADPDAVRAAWIVFNALQPDEPQLRATAWDNAQIIAAYGVDGPGAAMGPGYPRAAFGTSRGDDFGYRRRLSAMV